MKKGFTLIELLVVILILSILITIAAVTFGPAIARANETACKKLLGDLFKFCNMYYLKASTFPFAGEGMEAYQHWQVLFDNVEGISPTLLKCPAMGNVRVAEMDSDTNKVTLRPENCAYAYSREQCSPEHYSRLLAADKDFKRGNTGFGHNEAIVVLKCGGSPDVVKVKEGENWETVTKGELVK
ncbi:MAG: prepilin-type N-terminal cleavage/methylation domain-containing protein [Planctomycetota bacterium]|nr:prepilin-type N-terminal cleavage/methylation domain-containing protein [Planctomycetota bacterium]